MSPFRLFEPLVAGSGEARALWEMCDRGSNFAVLPYTTWDEALVALARYLELVDQLVYAPLRCALLLPRTRPHFRRATKRLNPYGVVTFACVRGPRPRTVPYRFDHSRGIVEVFAVRSEPAKAMLYPSHDVLLVHPSVLRHPSSLRRMNRVLRRSLWAMKVIVPAGDPERAATLGLLSARLELPPIVAGVPLDVLLAGALERWFARLPSTFLS